MNEALIHNILVNEYGYSDYEAEQTTHDLLQLQQRLVPAFEEWVSSRKESTITIGAISTAKLVSEKGFSYPAALIALDWVITDPETAVPVLCSNIRR